MLNCWIPEDASGQRDGTFSAKTQTAKVSAMYTLYFLTSSGVGMGIGFPDLVYSGEC